MIPGSLLSCIRLSHSLGREKADLPTMVLNIILLIHFGVQQTHRKGECNQESDKTREAARSAVVDVDGGVFCNDRAGRCRFPEDVVSARASRALREELISGIMIRLHVRVASFVHELPCCHRNSRPRGKCAPPDAGIKESVGKRDSCRSSEGLSQTLEGSHTPYLCGW